MSIMLAALFFVITPDILNHEVIPGYKVKEFTCRSCSEIVLNKELLIRLDILTKTVGVKLYITSGYRNISDNLRVNGEVNSAHLQGAAVDVALPKNRKRFVWFARRIFPVVLVNYKRNYAHLEI